MPEVGAVALQESEYWIWPGPQLTSPPKYHLQAPLPFSFTWSQPKLIVWEANWAPTWIRCQFDQASVNFTYISTCPCLEESSRRSNSPVKIEKTFDSSATTEDTAPMSLNNTKRGTRIYPRPRTRLPIDDPAPVEPEVVMHLPCTLTILLGWAWYPSFWSLSGVASAIFLPKMVKPTRW